MKNYYGFELILDLGECDSKVIRSKKKLTLFVNKLCKLIKMKKYGPLILEHFGYGLKKTEGYSLVQLIETSSIVAHFSEEWNSAYINIFSCQEFDVEKAKNFTIDFFKSKKVKSRFLKR